MPIVDGKIAAWKLRRALCLAFVSFFIAQPVFAQNKVIATHTFPAIAIKEFQKSPVSAPTIARFF